MLPMADSTQKVPVHKMPAAQRRTQIIQVAKNLFSQKGFVGTTTREIAKAAGVSEAIIFRHFATKEDLYAAIIDFIIQGYNQDLQAEMELAMKKKDDFRLFQTLALAILETHRKEPALLRLLLYSGLEGHKLSQLFMDTQVRPIYQTVSDYLSQRVKDKAVARCDTMVLVRGFLGMVSHHSLIRVIYGDPFLQQSNEVMSKEFARVFLNGILIRTSKKK